MNWIGPYTVDELLDSGLYPTHPKPPEENSVYVISKLAWRCQPTADCVPLYVGSNTGKSKRFITRIGDLVADMFGLFGSETGHHSGGQTLHEYCRKNNINPKMLFIGWLKNCICVRCAEVEIYKSLKPLLNSRIPPSCKIHHDQREKP